MHKAARSRPLPFPPVASGGTGRGRSEGAKVEEQSTLASHASHAFHGKAFLPPSKTSAQDIDGSAHRPQARGPHGPTTQPTTSPPSLRPSLPSSLPMADAWKRWGLDTRLLPILASRGMSTLLPVQAQVLPHLLPPLLPPARLLPSRDAVVCAPTGSGKTLIYVLVLLHQLANRRVGRLRGLVLVPSRDLATQVWREFQALAPTVGVKVGLAVGQSDFQAEQQRVMGWEGEGKEGGRGVDVMVATPGRLIDHLERTPGFTLTHLRYLVLDEADRLLNQSYQGWSSRIHHAIYSPRPGTFSLPPSAPPSPPPSEQGGGAVGASRRAESLSGSRFLCGGPAVESHRGLR